MSPSPVGRRSIGVDGPEISQICYGTMRLPPERAEQADRSPADHLNRLHDLGIDTIHSSHEYDTHELFLDALRRARRSGRRFQHIVKLSEPSFDDDDFVAARLRRLIDRELSSLETDSLTCVQWLVRTGDPQHPRRPIELVTERRERIERFFADQIDAGRIRSVAAFPYTVGYADAVLDLGMTEHLAAYLNLVETDFVPTLDRCRSLLAIRPLAGGRLADGDQADVERALRFPLLHPKVATIVVSLNSEVHLSTALAAAAEVTPDVDAFTNTLARYQARI